MFPTTQNLNTLLFKTVASLLAGLIPFTIAIFFLFGDSATLSGSILSVFGGICSIIVLVVYFIRLVTGKTCESSDKDSEGDTSLNTFSYGYKAEQLASAKGISETQAWDRLILLWTLRWVAFPCFVVILFGGAPYLILGYALIGLWYAFKLGYKQLSQAVNNLESQ